MVEFAFRSPGGLAAALERCRFLYGRLVEIDGQEVDALVALPISRLQLPLIYDEPVNIGWNFTWSRNLEEMYAWQ